MKFTLIKYKETDNISLGITFHDQFEKEIYPKRVQYNDIMQAYEESKKRIQMKKSCKKYAFLFKKALVNSALTTTKQKFYIYSFI